MSERTGRILGNYQVGALLGGGGLAEVYRATDRASGRDVALKILRPALAADPEVVARFRQLAPALVALDDPRIVPVLDWGQLDGCPFLALPFLAGGSLRAWLDAHAGLPAAAPRLALAWACRVAEGLAVAHGRGLVHGDIRPENLWPGDAPPDAEQESGAGMRVGDFGLAALVADRTLVGAPTYMAPELLQGHPPTAQADIYALGIVLYELLTGSPPFPLPSPATSPAASFSDAGYLHSRMPPRPPRELRPDLSPLIEAIVLRCLAKDPDARYTTATTLLVDLRAALVVPDARPAPAEDEAEGDKRELTADATPLPELRAADGAGLSIRLAAPPTLALIPGERAVARLAVANRGTVSVLVFVTVEGLPANWTLAPLGDLAVSPGGESPVELAVTVARDADSSAGEYPVTIRARSRDDALLTATAITVWTVAPFAEGELALTPARAHGFTGGTYELRVQHRGNAPLRRALWSSAAPSVRCTVTPDTVDLDPGAMALVRLRVATGRRWFGRAQAHPFAIEATSTSAAPLRATGEFVQRAVFPPWLLGVALATLGLLALIVTAAFVGVGPRLPSTAPPLATVAVVAQPTVAAGAVGPGSGAGSVPDPSVAASDRPRATATANGSGTVGGLLALSAATLDFGTLPPGANAVRNLQVRNTSARAVTFRSVQIVGTNATDFTRSGPCGTDPLDPNATCPIIVIFTPSGVGARTARLILTPLDGPAQMVELGGNGAGSSIGTPQIGPPTKPPPALAGERREHAAALLGDGQRLLVAGGLSGPNALKSVEVYNLATNTWLGVRDMGVARAGHALVTLPDGRVAAVGGRSGTLVLKSAESYSPGGQAWSAFPALTTAREGHTATVLADTRTRGYRILVLGGRGQGGAVLDSGEVYDSNTQTWTEIADLIPDGRARHTATLLQRNPQESPRLLLVGGVGRDGRPAPPRLYDPFGAWSWIAVPDEPSDLVGRVDFTATVVPATGRVVFIGGSVGGSAGGLTSAAVTVYDPAAPTERAWSDSPSSLPTGRSAHTATLLPYGQIVLVGGQEGGRDSATTLLLGPDFASAPPGMPPGQPLRAETTAVVECRSRRSNAGPGRRQP